MTDISQMPVDELEKLLAQRKKEERTQREREKKRYEKNRDARIDTLMSEAIELQLAMGRLKSKAHAIMNEQAEETRKYGKIRSDSKGGFSIFHTNGIHRITRTRDLAPQWDERAVKAVGLIKSFLGDTVKRKDEKLYGILMGFLEKNANGDLEYADVLSLIQYQDYYDDPRWIEGLKLIQESFSRNFKAFGYEFKVKNKEGKWENLVLNFSSI